MRDTFAFTNELKWVYHHDPETGKSSWSKRPLPPAYSLHCFVLADRVRQFWWHARFNPDSPRVPDDELRKRVRRIIRRKDSGPDGTAPVEIPGYPDLRSFSGDKALLLQDECGRAWRSYLQRGHWRMVFPFSRRGQEATANRLLKKMESGTICAVHVVRFPSLKINHSLVLFAAADRSDTIHFAVYDPNTPQNPISMSYDRRKGTFHLDANEYYMGGPVNVYEVYRNLIY